MKKKLPKVIGLRILLIGWFLHLLLIGPYQIVVALQGIPELLRVKENSISFNSARDDSDIADENQKKEGAESKRSYPGQDSVFAKQDSSLVHSPDMTGKDDESRFVVKKNINESNTKFFWFMVLISIGLHIIMYRPLKKFFKALRKEHPVDEQQKRKLQRQIHRVPMLHTAIFALPLVVEKIEEIFLKYTSHTDSVLKEVFFSGNYFLVSSIAALVTIIFVYQWFQYNVQTKYLEFIIPKEQLINRELSFFKGKIRNRLWTSSLMTTFFPIFIVFVYLVVSVSTLPELSTNEMSQDIKLLLFGKLKDIIDVDLYSKIPKWSIYFNLPNSMLMVFGMISSMIISFIYVYFFIKWTTNRIVVPIRDLLENMQYVQEGDFTHYTYIRTNDEMGRLTAGHNVMVEKLGSYVDDIKSMNDAYRRFVPQQFLDFLGKEKFSDIRLGDQVEKVMTVLFTDIRSFTSISEKMTPQENFQFINEYLRYMEPVISKNNGFIDKYIGDAIMALFPDSPDDALKAAIEMRQELKKFNSQRENPEEVDMGIGIHTGRLMLGVIGGKNRMDGTVISDAVNLAARLEGLTKVFGKSIIISEETKASVKNSAGFNFKYIEKTSVKGKKNEVKIYAVEDK
jgi:class 3 adenylate cyclase